MGLPQNTSFLKIHPAIGIARLSSSPDFFILDSSNPASQFKTNNLIKRQAVRFTLVAYDSGGIAIEEIAHDRLSDFGLSTEWIAEVANRKISDEKEDSVFDIHATTSSANGGKLEGNCANFDEGGNIPLGTIRPDGVFVPPRAGTYRETLGQLIPERGMWTDDLADNSSDGVIRCKLTDSGSGAELDIPIIPSRIIVAPPDFSPDFDDGVEGSRLPRNENLLQYLSTKLGASAGPFGSPLNKRAQDLDAEQLQRATANFSPGVEVSNYALEQNAFQSFQHLGDPTEVRFSPPEQNGPDHGELTKGLCSPWQFDFRACTCNYWPNQRPDTAVRGGNTVNWRRLKADEVGDNPPGGLADSNKEFIERVYELGIHRRDSSTHEEIDTERDNDID